MKSAKTYKFLSQFYDEFVGQDRYHLWQKMIKKILRKYKINTGPCVDLACGTGTVSKIIYDLKFDVCGVDISSDMLKIARHKYPKIKFRQGDFLHLYKLKLSNQKLVTCFYDSMNYLLSLAQLKKALKEVYNILAIDGIFVLDLNTPEHLQNISQGKAGIFTKDGLCVIYYSKCKGRLWLLTFDIFKQNSRGFYKLFREKHVERVYQKEEVLKIATDIGFQVLETSNEYKKGQKGKKYNNRIYYIFKKV